MKYLVDAGVLLGVLTVRVNMDWSRFILSMFVLAGLLGYMIYSWGKR
ncbi:MAG TPA: hypothetical protein VHX13_11350 [Acidobacteriaceae bacterium]|jgi:hypothetical protein|nr:hypothetical protein [Acidobacteriaceae bacterium]